MALATRTIGDLGCSKWVIAPFYASLLWSLVVLLVSLFPWSSIAHAQNRRVRIGTVYFSESFINEQLKKHISLSESLKALEVDLKKEGNTIRVHGLYQLPFDDVEGLGLDPRMTQFRFQLSVRASINQEGYLVLEFPLEESFFYQALSGGPAPSSSGPSALGSSAGPTRFDPPDRIMIPVQLLSLGLATARSRLAALSGDFSAMDRKRDKISALIRGTEEQIAKESNIDAKRVLLNRKQSLELQLESEKLSREQLAQTGRTLKNVMDLLGIADFNLNNKLKAKGNTLFLKLKLTSLISYLKDIELGRVRVQHKDRYGRGEDYFALDVDSTAALDTGEPVPERLTLPERDLEVAPSIHIRLNQELLLKQIVRETKAEKMAGKVKDFQLVFKDDGLHAVGKVKLWFVWIPFDTLVDFVSTEPDVFEVRLRRLKAWGMNFKILVPFALRAVESRLDSMFRDLLTYQYLGEVDETRALKVTVDSQKLVPAFPGLHLLDIDVVDGSIMLRIGRKKEEVQ